MSVYLLKSTLSSLEKGDDLDEECKQWLLAGLGQFYLRGNRLEQLLGLRIPVPPGGAHLQPLAIDKLGRRNKLLQSLAELLPGDSDLERSKNLVVMIRHFPMMADEHGKSAEFLIRKLMADHRENIPRSAKQVQRILEGATIPDLTPSGHRIALYVRDPFSGTFPPTRTSRGPS